MNLTSGFVTTGGDTGTCGSGLNQFSPHGLYVDQNGSMYVSDANNHHVLKYIAGATQGIIVASGNGL
ncbi:unnamed protein product [Didymodactylos carnosus]|uniref:NHL repeat-containing protein n=1 Tax=Didymodactylos carnosus TaxID=1234261 RepID=A0A816CGF3_9BILA|nr:unnamed protein product [Didymodactylos carnosus]CAF4517394.1 unnamed protein product [Didymodactylos carnosus]